MAESLADYLNRHAEIEEKCSKNGKILFYTTDAAEDFDKQGAIFYGHPISSQHVDLL